MLSSWVDDEVLAGTDRTRRPARARRAAASSPLRGRCPTARHLPIAPGRKSLKAVTSRVAWTAEAATWSVMFLAALVPPVRKPVCSASVVWLSRASSTACCAMAGSSGSGPVLAAAASRDCRPGRRRDRHRWRRWCAAAGSVRRTGDDATGGVQGAGLVAQRGQGLHVRVVLQPRGVREQVGAGGGDRGAGGALPQRGRGPRRSAGLPSARRGAVAQDRRRGEGRGDQQARLGVAGRAQGVLGVGVGGDRGDAARPSAPPPRWWRAGGSPRPGPGRPRPPAGRGPSSPVIRESNAGPVTELRLHRRGAARPWPRRPGRSAASSAYTCWSTRSARRSAVLPGSESLAASAATKRWRRNARRAHRDGLVRDLDDQRRRPGGLGLRDRLGQQGSPMTERAETVRQRTRRRSTPPGADPWW